MKNLSVIIIAKLLIFLIESLIVSLFWKDVISPIFNVANLTYSQSMVAVLLMGVVGSKFHVGERE